MFKAINNRCVWNVGGGGGDEDKLVTEDVWITCLLWEVGMVKALKLALRFETCKVFNLRYYVKDI